MKKLLAIVFIGLFFSGSGYAEYVRSVQWEKNSTKAYKECTFFGFFCEIYMDVSSNKSNAEIGSYISVFDKEGNKIEKFMVHTIFYEKARNLCIVSNQDKKEPDTYLSARNCTKSKKSARDKKSDKNRKKTKIKLLCELDKINVIKNVDGTLINKWYDKKFIKKNFSLINQPIKYETSKNSYAIWIDESGMLLDYHDDNGFGYFVERDAKEKNYITLHYTSINYLDLTHMTKMSVDIINNESKYQYSFKNKPEISSIGHGTCKKLKWKY